MTDVQRFELPRDDWYDSDGRIYKDAIIENLNAIEAKLLELQRLDAFDVELPDLNTIVYPDVTLSSEDNCIINLRSFLSIMNLTNYPIECRASGKTIKRFAFWNSSYQYKLVENQTVSTVSDSNPYVYYDLTDNTIKAAGSFTPSSDKIFIGKFINGEIITVFEKAPLNVNLLQMLADTKITTADFNSHHTYVAELINGNVVGYTDGESKAPQISARFQNKGE